MLFALMMVNNRELAEIIFNLLSLFEKGDAWAGCNWEQLGATGFWLKRKHFLMFMMEIVSDSQAKSRSQWFAHKTSCK